MLKKPQLITLVVGIALVVVLYAFGRTIPIKKVSSNPATNISNNSFSTDTFLAEAKKRLTPQQVFRLDALEHSVVRGDVKDQQIKIYHQLAHFWLDTAQLFEPYGWYEAEAARLENSEKSLTFAAHLFLTNLREENNPDLKTWKALQARDLFERSLKINPYNDSSLVGLGACYIFGNISETPMEGIQKVLSVVNRDSTNVFAQEILGHGSMLSGQYDKAIARFKTEYRLSNQNPDKQITACWMLGEAYEKMNDNASAANWYEKSLPLIKNENIKVAVKGRIDELRK